MPFVRGRIIPETESTGRVKRTLDVLIWAAGKDRSTLLWFDELQQLREYLKYIQPPICSIRLLAAGDDQKLLSSFGAIGIDVTPVEKSTSFGRIPQSLADQLPDDLKVATATALQIDADCIVTDDAVLLPYAEDIAKVGTLLTTPDFLLRYAEFFVRGHDLPWAFAYKVWFEPWIAFYQLSEEWLFKPGLQFLSLCQSKGVDPSVVEIGRSLVYNRLGDMCFTRDRLSFYEMQQSAAKRAQWKRQKFSAEIAYYLNYYYVLLYGAFEHAAVFVNGLLKLGVSDRRVGALNPEFLKALEAKSPEVSTVFGNTKHVDFIRRVAAVRHTTAHRGIVTPTVVVEAPAAEPTADELDDDIRKAGLDYLLVRLQPGPSRDGFQEMLRTNARMARYEQQTLMEDVILIELGGKYAFINPLIDTWWNFKCCTGFLNEVFGACAKVLV